MKTEVLLIPGLYDSGPEHWQTRWQEIHPEFHRLRQEDWETPKCEDWVAALDRAVAATGPEVVLVAHSLGCALVAHWARRRVRAGTGLCAHAALLVAPSDVEADIYPPGTEGFAPMPLDPLPFPSLVVASEDDPWVSLERARSFARSWGSDFISIDNVGHINSASGLGSWPLGLAFLTKLRRAAGETDLQDDD
jgi:uncharacterized protein